MRNRFPLFTTTFLALSVFAMASTPTVTQIGQLSGTDLQSASFFGKSTISQDGRTIAVGAPQGDGTAGEIYVYEKPSGGWRTMTQTARLHPTSQCMVGSTLAISGDGGTIVSFAGGCSGGGFLGIGWLELFVRPASGWQDTSQPTAVLALNNSGSYNDLGLYLGISADGNTVVTTGLFYYPRKTFLFVFNKPAHGWTNMGPSSSIFLSNKATEPEAVALNGRTIAVTNQPDNTVRVFQRSAAGLQQVATLMASDGERFCCSLAMDGQNIIVNGYPSDNATGKVYLFAKPSSGWANATETAQFPAPDGIGFLFGWTFSISGKNLLIGGLYSGAAYLYVRPSGGWQTTSQPNVTLVSSDPDQQNFGDSVAIVGGTLVVADENAGADNSRHGAAYVYNIQ